MRRSATTTRRSNRFKFLNGRFGLKIYGLGVSSKSVKSVIGPQMRPFKRRLAQDEPGSITNGGALAIGIGEAAGREVLEFMSKFFKIHYWDPLREFDIDSIGVILN